MSKEQKIAAVFVAALFASAVAFTLAHKSEKRSQVGIGTRGVGA